MHTAYVLPSDCAGNGFDIACAPHADDRPCGVLVEGGRIVRRAKIYANGFFCGYSETEIERPSLGGVEYRVVDTALPASQGSGRFWTMRRVAVEARDKDTGRRRRLPNGCFLISVGDYRQDVRGVSAPEGARRDALVEQARALAVALNAA